MVTLIAETDWVSASAAWAAAFAAIVYTGFTIWFTIETRSLRRLQSDPRVILHVPTQSCEGLHRFDLKNIGGGTAFHVRVTLGPSIGKATSDLILPPILERGFLVLSPGQSESFELPVDDAIRKAWLKTRITNVIEAVGMQDEDSGPHLPKSISVQWNDVLQGGKRHTLAFPFPPDPNSWRRGNVSD